MSRICLVDSGSCARASRSLQVHRGYWHYPWYFDTKLPYNYIPIVILQISMERIIDLEDTKPTFFFHIILSALTLYAPKCARRRAVKP